MPHYRCQFLIYTRLGKARRESFWWWWPYNLPLDRWFCSVGPPGCSGDRFYGLGAATKRGRRQEPRTTATPPSLLRRELLAIPSRSCPPSSFGSRFGRTNNKTPSSVSVGATDDLKIPAYEPNPGPKGPTSCASARNNDFGKNDHLRYRTPDG